MKFKLVTRRCLQESTPALDIPTTQDIEIEVMASIKKHLKSKGFYPQQSDDDSRVPNLLLHYRYAVDAAVLRAVFQHTQGNQARAARILGINRGALRHLSERLGIYYEDFR